ncbi:hypothetical protein, partial [Cronobacter dublinensis]|uniref:hypothetical protein n=1 Tax=Cronobacter dublinensis TaxID=413497 RepID=UPI001F3AB4CB
LRLLICLSSAGFLARFQTKLSGTTSLDVATVKNLSRIPNKSRFESQSVIDKSVALWLTNQTDWGTHYHFKTIAKAQSIHIHLP